MKKIAIQLFGHLRSYKDTYISFNKNLLEPLKKEGYEIDVFLHSWTETDTSEQSWHNINGDTRGRNTSNDDITCVRKFYKPKKFKLEKQLLVDNFELREKFMNLPRQYSAIINSAYTKFRVNELRLQYEKENNIHYDYIIQTRPDILFNNEFGIDKFLNTYKTYGFEVPKNSVFTSCVPFRRGPIESDIFLCSIDLILFSVPEVMNKINNLYNSIISKELSEEWVRENLYSLEILWLMYLKYLNIDLVRLKYFQFEDYDIVRDIKEYSKIPQFKDASILKQEHKKTIKLKKIQREILKLFPYFMVKKFIDKINNEIYKEF